MEQPYFSIVLPVYNVETYLARCIESIVHQSFTNYEMILVDDGSGDGSGAICDAYAKQDERIQVIHKANGGLSSARNAGMKKARGRYIFFVDSDDWIEPEALACLYGKIENNPCDVLKFNFYNQPSGEETISSISTGIYEKDEITNCVMHEAIKETGRINFSAWSHVYRTELLKREKIEFVSEREIGSEDYLFNFQVYLCANRMQVIAECLYDYDCREGSLSRRYRPALFEQYYQLQVRMEAYADKKGVKEFFAEDLKYSYIWKNFYVVMRNELVRYSDRGYRNCVRRIDEILRHEKLREMLKDYSFGQESLIRKFQIVMMRHRMKWTISAWMVYSLHKEVRRTKNERDN